MKQQWRIPILCVVASGILVIYHYSAQPAFFDAHIARRFLFRPVNELYRYLYFFGATFVLLGLLPAATACVLWNERPSEWGLSFGSGKMISFAVTLALFIATLPLLVYASGIPSIAAGHPLSRLAVKFRKALIIYECLLFLYMAGWEFFFRGFLLFGLKNTMGAGATYLQVVPYTIMHLGRPAPETLASIPAAIVLGHLAARTGSIWYGVILHWLCAGALDIFVIYRPF